MKIKHIDISNNFIDMFDVCNTKNECFVANGIITHNSSADMSKKALIKIRNDEELIKRKVKPIIPVHDEILIETPLRYAKYVKARFAEDMETAAKPELTIPVSCDVVSALGWYHDELDIDAELHGLPDV
jgi:DNA polymerase I-like protein with 3'-5' exonuclease and polymerase domains